MSTPLRPRITTAFFAQSVISFAVSLAVTITGICYLHDSRWIRAFLALGLLYLLTSSFTLAQCIRDRQEQAAIVNRAGQARLDKLLAEQTSSVSRTADGRLPPEPVCPPCGIMWVTFGHLRPSGHIMPDHGGDRGAAHLDPGVSRSPPYQP